MDVKSLIHEATFGTNTTRGVLVKHRDAALALETAQDEEDNTPETEANDAIQEAVLDLYRDVATALGLLDTETSASRQHWIETGAYLLHGEAI